MVDADACTISASCLGRQGRPRTASPADEVVRDQRSARPNVAKDISPFQLASAASAANSIPSGAAPGGPSGAPADGTLCDARPSGAAPGGPPGAPADGRLCDELEQKAPAGHPDQRYRRIRLSRLPPVSSLRPLGRSQKQRLLPSRPASWQLRSRHLGWSDGTEMSAATDRFFVGFAVSHQFALLFAPNFRSSHTPRWAQTVDLYRRKPGYLLI